MIIKAVIPDPESLDRECSVCAVSFVCKRHQTDLNYIIGTLIRY